MVHTWTNQFYCTLCHILDYFIYLFIIIQTIVTMNKVKTIDKVNLSMMIKSQEELNYT